MASRLCHVTHFHSYSDKSTQFQVIVFDGGVWWSPLCRAIMLDVLHWLLSNRGSLEPEHCFRLVVVAGSFSDLSSRPLLRYFECTALVFDLSVIQNWGGPYPIELMPLPKGHRPCSLRCNWQESRILSGWPLALEWALFGATLIHHGTLWLMGSLG